MSKIKLAFVGCGAITRNAHLPAGLRSPLADVYALVDASPDNARELARMYGLDAIVTGDLDEVIDGADAFVLATPNDTHHPIAKRILERGKPVLIEKPITTVYDDAVELCELADRQGTFISVGYRYRFFPSVRFLKRLLDDDYFGRVVGFHFEMGSVGGWSPISGYNLDKNRSGGGVLVINGTHFLDLALNWFGDPVSFRYEDDDYGNVEANCKGVLTFRNDRGAFDGSFFFSKTIQLRNGFRIDTETHLVEWSPQLADSVVAVDRRRPDITAHLSPTEPTDAAADYFQVQLEEFCRNVREPGAVTSDGWNAARSVRLINQMYDGSTRLAEDWLSYRG